MNPILPPCRRVFAALSPFFAITFLGALMPAGLRAAQVEADTTEAFIDSLGVNVHWAYPIYYNNYATLKARLGELGIRHVRDAAVTSSGQIQVYQKSMDLFTTPTHKIKTTFLTGRRLPGPWPQPLNPTQNAISTELGEIKANALACTAAIEGPNEYDISRPDSEAGGTPPTWVGKVKTYQQILYAQVRADSAFQNIPVIGPSFTHLNNYALVGSLDAWIDHACIHHYKGDRHPEIGGWGSNGYGSITWAYNYLVNVQSPAGKAVQSTECGYHNAITIYNPQTQQYDDAEGLPVEPQGRYTPRTLAEFFRRGFYRSFIYELVDQGTSGVENVRGLLYNNLQPKPAFTALKNLIAILKEPDADFVAGTLDYTLGGSITNVREVLLQKSNGQFYLLIWKGVSCWNPEDNVNLSVAASNVTLTFNQPVKEVAVFKPSVSTAVQGTPSVNPTSVNLSVPDELLVVRITPAASYFTPPGTLSAFSSESGANPAVRAVDGIENTDDNRWSAAGYGYPQWIEVDLGKNKLINASEVVSYANRAYRFRVEAKPAGGTYQTVVDRTANTQPGPIADGFSAKLARYVKLTVTGAYNYTGDWVAIREFKVGLSSVPSVFKAEADAHVWDANPAVNYGAVDTLMVKDANSGTDRIAYLRFPLSGLSSPVTSATLKLTVVEVGGEGAAPRTVQVRQLASDSWTELGTTWSNRPAATGTLIGTIDAATTGQVYSINVTNYVNQEFAGDKKVSIVLVQPANANRLVYFGSREDTLNQPVLEIQP